MNPSTEDCDGCATPALCGDGQLGPGEECDSTEICTNGIDDNGNGQCDCLDAACASDAFSLSVACQ